MIVSILGEHRTEYQAPSVEGSVLLLDQLPAQEALIIDSFTTASTVEVSVIMPSAKVKRLLYAGSDPMALTYPEARAFYLNVRNKRNETQTFVIDKVLDAPRGNGTSDVTITGSDPRTFLKDYPTLTGTDGTNLVGTRTSVLQQLTIPLTNALEITGKLPTHVLPILPYDPSWEPSADERARGFVKGADVDPGGTVEILAPYPQAVHESYVDLMTVWSPDLELFPLEISGYDGTRSPFWRWVLRERQQTAIVLSEFSGTFKLDDVESSNLAVDTQNFRSDNNLVHAYASGNSVDSGQPNMVGPWLRMNFEEVSVNEAEVDSFVPRPALPKRLRFSGKGGVPYPVWPGSFGYVRDGEGVIPVYFNEVMSYFGESDWSLGAVTSEMVGWDPVSGAEVDTDSIILKVSGSSTYTIPMAQAPLPAGGATYSVWEGSTLLVSETFTTDPTSSTFNNILTVVVGDLAEHTLLIRVDAAGDTDVTAKAVFGRVNCYDGTLYSAGNSIFNYLREVVQLPLHGYLRAQTHSVHGAYHALYTYRQFYGVTSLTTVPLTETWGGYNETETIQALWGWVPLAGTEGTKAYRGIHEGQYEGCSSLTVTPVEANWSRITKLADGLRYRQYVGCGSLTGSYTALGDLSSVEAIVRPNGNQTSGLYRETWRSSRVTGVVNLSLHLDSCTTVLDRLFQDAFNGCAWTTTVNLEIVLGEKAIGEFFLYQVCYSSQRLTTFALDLPVEPETIGSSGLRGSAQGCPALVNLVLDGLESMVSAGNDFMYMFYQGSAPTAGTPVRLPDWALLETVGSNFLYQAFTGCRISSFVFPLFTRLRTAGHSFMDNMLWGSNTLSSIAMASFDALETVGDRFMLNGFRGSNGTSVTLPTFASLYQVGANFMATIYSQSTLLTGFAVPRFPALTVAGTGFMDGAVRGSTSVTEVTFANDAFPLLEVIPSGFFNNTFFGAGMSELIFPSFDAAVSVGNNFFTNVAQAATGLVSVTLPSLANCTSVGSLFMSYGFWAAPAILAMDFPAWNGFVNVGNDFLRNAVGSCASLASVTIPELIGVLSMGANFLFQGFIGCGNLEDVDFPSNFLNFSQLPNGFLFSTFEGCGKLASVDLPTLTGVTAIGTQVFTRIFFGCGAMDGQVLPAFASVTTVGANFLEDAFNSCGSLTTATLPTFGALTSLGQFALVSVFRNCQAMVTQPAYPNFGSATIGQGFMEAAFYGNGSLVTALPEPTFGTGKVISTRYFSQTYYACASLAPDQELINRDGGAIFTTSPAHPNQEIASTKMLGLAGVTVLHVDGGAVTVPADGTTAEGIPSNFYAA